jgi:hypothetical protein
MSDQQQFLISDELFEKLNGVVAGLLSAEDRGHLNAICTTGLGLCSNDNKVNHGWVVKKISDCVSSFSDADRSIFVQACYPLMDVSGLGLCSHLLDAQKYFERMADMLLAPDLYSLAELCEPVQRELTKNKRTRSTYLFKMIISFFVIKGWTIGSSETSRLVKFISVLRSHPRLGEYLANGRDVLRCVYPRQSACKSEKDLKSQPLGKIFFPATSDSYLLIPDLPFGLDEKLPKEIQFFGEKLGVKFFRDAYSEEGPARDRATEKDPVPPAQKEGMHACKLDCRKDFFFNSEESWFEKVGAADFLRKRGVVARDLNEALQDAVRHSPVIFDQEKIRRLAFLFESLSSADQKCVSRRIVKSNLQISGSVWEYEMDHEELTGKLLEHLREGAGDPKADWVTCIKKIAHRSAQERALVLDEIVKLAESFRKEHKVCPGNFVCVTNAPSDEWLDISNQDELMMHVHGMYVNFLRYFEVNNASDEPWPDLIFSPRAFEFIDRFDELCPKDVRKALRILSKTPEYYLEIHSNKLDYGSVKASLNATVNADSFFLDVIKSLHAEGMASVAMQETIIRAVIIYFKKCGSDLPVSHDKDSQLSDVVNRYLTSNFPAYDKWPSDYSRSIKNVKAELR